MWFDSERYGWDMCILCGEYTKNVKSYEDLQLYDVITYYNGETLICHRIVDLYESDNVKYIVTQGDANNTIDTPISFALVKGKVTSIMPNCEFKIIYVIY